MATRLRSTTTADILHECLIQKIISYLSFQEAAKMSILSKTWLQAWFTHPNLEFRVHCCKDFETVDKILARYRDRKIPINKFKFWNFSDYNSSKVFALLDKWLGIAIQNGVRDLLYRDLSFSRSLHGILETGIEKIDAPTVVSIEYKGDRVSEHKIAKESNQLKHSEIVPHCSNNLNAAWFCKLRNFLSNLTSLSQVSLYFVKCNDINMKDLQLRHSVPAAQLDVLNVDIRSFETCPTFVDALLWSCHPRRLNVHSGSKMVTCFLDHLMNLKNSSHSNSHRRNPWHSQLKQVKAYSFDQNNQPVELRSGELARSNLWERKKINFLLDW